MSQVHLLRLDPRVRPLHFALAFEIDPESDSFAATETIDVMFDVPVPTLQLHGQGLNVSSAGCLIDGKNFPATRFVQDAKGNANFEFGKSLGPGLVQFTFRYSARYALGLEGIYRSKVADRHAVFTQFQAIGARRGFFCFDEPGFKAPFDISVTSPSWCKAVGNTREISAEGSDVVTHRFATSKPLPSYLIALCVGDFDVIEHQAIAPGPKARAAIPLRGIARKGSGKDLAAVLQRTEPIVHFAERYFDIAYPFDKLDIIAVPDMAAGGMENAGAITYDEALALLDEDAEFDRHRSLLTTHAHEITHQWFGNLVTPVWWDDLWLNESFATFMEAKISHNLEPDWHFDTDLVLNAEEAMELDILPSVRRVHEPVESEDAITTAFDAITYQKGSVVLSAIEQTLGEEHFRSAVRSLLKTHAYGVYSKSVFTDELKKLPRGDAAVKLLDGLIDNTGVPAVNTAAEAFQDDGGTRYQRARLSAEMWHSVLQEVHQFSRPKALTVAIDFDLALQTDEISLPFYLEGVIALSRHAEWQVAGHAFSQLSFLLAELPERGDISQAVTQAYRADFDAVHYRPLDGEKDFEHWRAKVKRSALVRFLATNDVMPQYELELAGYGMRLARSADMFEVEWFPVELVGSACIAAARLNHPEVLDKAVELLSHKQEAWQRETLLEIIAASRAQGSDGTVETLLNGALLRNQEITYLLSERAKLPDKRTVLWDMVRRNGLKLSERLDGDADISLIQVANAFTTRSLAAEVSETLTPWLDQLRGGRPQLQLTIDRILANATLLEKLGHKAQ